MSRLVLIEQEFPDLIASQVKAAGSKHYNEWLSWMLSTYSYTMAMRMCNALHYLKPCREWYEDMKVCGQRIMKEMYATERVNYRFSGDPIDEYPAGAGEQEAASYSTNRGVRAESHS